MTIANATRTHSVRTGTAMGNRFMGRGKREAWGITVSQAT
jgi:hypothetical protein